MNDFSKKEVEAKFSELLPIIDQKLKDGGKVTFTPYGISMIPLLVPGRDSVTIEIPKRDLKKNDIVFYRRKNGQFVLHRVESVKKDQSLVLRGDNQLKKEYGLDKSYILAVVTEIKRGEKTLDLDGAGYKAYTKILRHLYRAFLWVKVPIKKFAKRILRLIKK